VRGLLQFGHSRAHLRIGVPQYGHLSGGGFDVPERICVSAAIAKVPKPMARSAFNQSGMSSSSGILLCLLVCFFLGFCHHFHVLNHYMLLLLIWSGGCISGCIYNNRSASHPLEIKITSTQPIRLQPSHFFSLFASKLGSSPFPGAILPIRACF
jgi:hypothetical protein